LNGVIKAGIEPFNMTRSFRVWRAGPGLIKRFLADKKTVT
jgi:hypothetical protein